MSSRGSDKQAILVIITLPSLNCFVRSIYSWRVLTGQIVGFSGSEGKKNSFNDRPGLLCFARWLAMKVAPSGINLRDDN